VAARRVVTVILDAIPTGFVAGMRTATVSAKEFGGKLDELAVKHTASFNKIANTTGLIGGVLVGAFALAERSAMAFDKQMSAVASVAGASAGQLQQLRAAALQAGKDTAFTATQAAQAEEELAKAGISTADILSGALHGSLVLAAAGDIDLARSATIAAQAMTEFGLKGKDVGQIADILVAGANASVTSVSALGESLDQVGSVAANAHFTLSETVGVLSDFAQQGLVGEEAGTALKTMLIKLQAPTEKSAALMKSLGINVYDSNGQFIGAAELAGQLQTALSGVSEQTRNAALGTIFGTRAVRGAIDMYKAGSAGIQGWIDQVDASGAAADAAGMRQDNLSGDVHKLIGSLQALAINGTSQANQGLRLLAQGAEGAVNAFADLPGPVQAVGGDIVAISGTLLLGTAGFLKARGAMLKFNEALAATGPLGTKAVGVLGSLGSAATKAGVVGLVVFGAYEGFKALGVWSDGHAKPVAHNIDAMAVSLRDFAVSGKAAGELAKTFGVDLSGLARDMSIVAHIPPTRLGITGPTSQFQVAAQRRAMRDQQDAWAQSKKNIEDLDAALTQVATSGGATQAALEFDKVTDALLAQGMTMPQILKMFPEYQKVALGAKDAAGGLAQGFADTSEQAKLMNGSLDDAIDKLGDLDSVFKALNGANIDAETTLISFRDDLDKFSKTLQGNDKVLTKHKRSLDDNTAAGRDNQTQIIALIKDAEAHSQAVLTQTGSVDKARDAYYKQIDAMKKTLLQAGFTGAQVDWMIDQFGKLPPAATIPVTTPGMASAISGLQTIYTWQGLVNGRHVKVHVDTTSVSANTRFPGISVNRWGGMYQHAAVGTLREAVYSPPVARGARYAWAEPETRGEIFIPKAGNYGRSMALIRAAAGWYGASVQPRGGSGVTFNVHADAAAFWRFMRLEVQNHGGAAKAFS
jgi:TP901 family phage tail tape measure protein